MENVPSHLQLLIPCLFGILFVHAGSLRVFVI